MENREISTNENLECPYCKKVLLDTTEIEPFQTCQHTIFVCTDNGFEYIHPNYTTQINPKEKSLNFDKYTLSLPFKGIRIAQYNPPPSHMGAYWGFMPNETKHFQEIEITINTNQPVYCPYTGFNLMQDFDQVKVPKNLLLAIHSDLPDTPIYIKEEIEDEFLEILDDSDYEINLALEKSQNILSEYNGLIVIKVTSGDASTPLCETITFVVGSV
jgi:hypothetical protein